MEFLVQGLRLLHAHGHAGLRAGGTLPSLEALAAAGILDGDEAREITDDYLFLRRVRAPATPETLAAN